MIQGYLNRNVVELMIEEYKNAEKADFIDWNAEDDFEDEHFED